MARSILLGVAKMLVALSATSIPMISGIAVREFTDSPGYGAITFIILSAVLIGGLLGAAFHED